MVFVKSEKYKEIGRLSFKYCKKNLLCVPTSNVFLIQNFTFLNLSKLIKNLCYFLSSYIIYSKAKVYLFKKKLIYSDK